MREIEDLEDAEHQCQARRHEEYRHSKDDPVDRGEGRAATSRARSGDVRGCALRGFCAEPQLQFRLQDLPDRVHRHRLQNVQLFREISDERCRLSSELLHRSEAQRNGLDGA